MSLRHVSKTRRNRLEDATIDSRWPNYFKGEVAYSEVAEMLLKKDGMIQYILKCKMYCFRMQITKNTYQSFVLTIALSLVSVFECGAADSTSPHPKKPNIILILSDDQAWTDYGFMGHPVIKTPNLDKLADRSRVFKRGYVASPLCRPSLASIATGLQPFQHGVTGNDVDGNRKRAELDIPLRQAFHNHPSFIKLLHTNGYQCFQSGKWWEGSWKDGGFTGGMTHGDPKRRGRHGDEGLRIGRDTMKPVTDFIDQSIAKAEPFFIWYAPFLPHTPHNPPKRLLDKYTGKGLALDVAKYYANCEWLDETCGQLFNHLDKKNIAEETVIIYICDNGWVASSVNKEDPNQKLWGGYAQRSKASPYENGIRTPILVSWPSHIKPGDMKDLAHSIDIFPTVAGVIGVKPPKNLTGVDLLNDESLKNRKAVFGVCHSSHNMNLGKPNETLQYQWCIEGDWKILVRYSGIDTTKYKNLHVWDKAPVRLYNITKDPQEVNDVSSSFPDVVSQLRKKIELWHSVAK